MKISYNWLKEFVETEMPAEELAEALSLVGFEVEDVQKLSLDIPGIVVGKVVEKEKHPNADRLSHCKVDVGGEQLLSIVCGAPNVAAGQTVAVATVNTELPNGLKIKKAKIRGVVSEGMICSEEELGLASKSDGIWVLVDTLKVGMPLHEALAFETDYILDISITPNRPDAMSHIGIAREVAAITGLPLKLPEPKFDETEVKTSDLVAVEIACPDSCPRYATRVIKNIRIQPSPEWMQRRLIAVGMRPINNIVDITNYVMLETGQPLHAFDYDLIADRKIVVRKSAAGEKFVTLDEKERTLESGTVLICDGEKPVALGGIMGGLNSEVTEQTKNVLLESAYFMPESIQRSLRYLGINSEAAQRFERGVDPNGTLLAMNRAVEMLKQYAQGKVTKGVVDVYPQPIAPKRIELNDQKINRLLGTTISKKQMAEFLNKIGIEVVDGIAVVPTFRPDVERIADLAEEVARLYGYDNIEEAAKTPVAYSRLSNPFDDYVDALKTTLTGIGLQEVLTNSLINSKEYQELSGEPVYPILNPLNSDLDGLRNTLVPSLLKVIQYNFYRQRKDLAIFEINRVFKHPGTTTDRALEFTHLVVALCGQREGDHWLSSGQNMDFFDIKGVVEYLAEKNSLDNFSFIKYDNFCVNNQSLKIVWGDREIGFLGKLSDKIQKKYDIDLPVYVAQLDVQQLFEISRNKTIEFKELPKYPFVERDFAVIVANDAKAEDLLQTIRNTAGSLLVNAYVFDVYTGKQVAQGAKSLAFRMIFQSPERTLTEEEVNLIFEKVIKNVVNSHGAKLRT
jgi:phenylalanyl-tRNA synthetase beta chain